jgi:hypothetical protein
LLRTTWRAPAVPETKLNGIGVLPKEHDVALSDRPIAETVANREPSSF